MDLRTRLDKIVSDAETGEKAPHRALTLPRLRPYLWDGHTLRVLGAGLAIIAGGALRIVGKGLRAAFAGPAEKPAPKEEKPSSEAKGAKQPKGPSLADTAERLAVGAFGLLIAGVVAVVVILAVGPRLRPYVPALFAVGVLVLIIAAFVVAPDVPRKPKRAAEAELPDDLPDDAEDDPQDAPEGRRLAFLRWLEKETRGASGIHLDQMHARLTKLGASSGLPRHHLRPLLDHYQVPVQRTLRVGTVAGRSGVTRQAIEEAVRAATAAPPLGAEGDLESPTETAVDLPFSTDSPAALQAVESGA